MGLFLVKKLSENIGWYYSKQYEILDDLLLSNLHSRVEKKQLHSTRN